MVSSTRSNLNPYKAAEDKPIKSRPVAAATILLLGIAAIVFGLMLSVSLGAADIRLSTVWEAVFRFNPELGQHQVIRELRIPALWPERWWVHVLLLPARSCRG